MGQCCSRVSVNGTGVRSPLNRGAGGGTVAHWMGKAQGQRLRASLSGGNGLKRASWWDWRSWPAPAVEEIQSGVIIQRVSVKDPVTVRVWVLRVDGLQSGFTPSLWASNGNAAFVPLPSTTAHSTFPISAVTGRPHTLGAGSKASVPMPPPLAKESRGRAFCAPKCCPSLPFATGLPFELRHWDRVP